MSVHLITGAGSGIGSVVARRLLDRGDQVVVLARDAIAGPADEIVHTPVRSTWFAGREVYTAG